MKKTMIVLSAVLALVACNKVAPETENNGTIDASKLVFDITITNADATKAVKDGWKTGDKVYLFFEGNRDAYVTMTYESDSWGGPTATGTGSLSLSATGKHVTAVYLPFNTADPTYDDDDCVWKFDEKVAYYMTAEAQDYTVTTDPSTDLSTLSATLEMNNNAGFVQILVEDASPVEGKYVMYAPGLIPTWCGSIAPGGSVTPGKKAAGLPIEPVIVTGEGYYFYGTVSSSIFEPTFYIVEQDPTYKYAIGTHVKMAPSGKSLAAKAAVKFTSLPYLTDLERWVDLGLSVKWATGNLSGSPTVNGYINHPTYSGDYYSWRRLEEIPSPFYNISDDGTDTAFQLLGGNWRMPTKDEFIELCGASGENAKWISSPAGIVVRGANGLAVFFPAAGNQLNGSQGAQGNCGGYWSSDEYGDDHAYYLFFDLDGNVYPDSVTPRYFGYSVRPVQNIVTP